MLIIPFNVMVALTGRLWQKSSVVLIYKHQWTSFFITKTIVRLLYDKADT